MTRKYKISSVKIINFFLKYKIYIVCIFLGVCFLSILDYGKNLKGKNENFYELIFQMKGPLIISDEKKYENNFEKNISRRINEEFLSYFKSNMPLKKIIEKKFSNEIISIRLNPHGLLVQSKIKIDKKTIRELIEIEYENHKNKYYKRKSMYLFCDNSNSKKYMTELIFDLINYQNSSNIKKKIDSQEYFFICKSDIFNKNIFFIKKNIFFNAVKKARIDYIDNYLVNINEFETNNKEKNLLLSIILFYSFFMIIKFSK